MAVWTRALIGAGAVAAGVAATAFAARTQRTELARIERHLIDAAERAPEAGRVDVERLGDAPPPVVRYLRRVLAHGQARIRIARLVQHGRLKTAVDSERWLAFEATQLIAPDAPGFVWNAQVGLAPLLNVRVRDAFVEGRGSGKVLLASALAVASATGGPELNAGALHRYLAEAVWYPTALLPSDRLSWRAIDDNTARATLSVEHTTVSLDFKFGDNDEVTGVYTSARWAQVAGGFVQMPWEGRFSDYRRTGDWLVPHRAEAGWYTDAWRPVWRGTITDAAYETAAAP